MKIIIKTQVKKLLSPQSLSALKALITVAKRLKLAYQVVSFPIKKYFYTAAILVYPNEYWGYERLLNLIWQHRSHDLLRCSKLFLHYFQIYRDLNPECILKWRIEVCVLHLMLHDTENLEKFMQEAIDVQEVVAKQKKLDILRIRLINEDIFQYYNAHAYLDTQIKAMLMGWMPESKIVLLTPPGDTAVNTTMLKYWKQYITVIDDEMVVRQLSPLKKYIGMDSCMVANLNGKAVYIEHAKGIVQKEWERQNRQPLFKLSSEDEEWGWEYLKKIGIPKGSWFVCIHVRDAGYKTGSYQNKEAYDSYRNADIVTYELAIREIVKRGGYVIRVGDPNMKPFISMDRYFDYAHSNIRSNRMDIFLFSQCRFFVGVSSGPVLTPVLFGVPVVMTNFAPMSGRPHAGNCIFIPKMIWLKRENRYAGFHEVLSSDLGRMFSSHGYEEKEADLIDNSPEDIRDVVVEMMDRLDGTEIYSKEDENRQRAITELYQKYSGYGDMGRIGNAFINKYANLCMK